MSGDGKRSMTIGTTQLTKFGVATLIFVDIRHPTISWEATEIRRFCYVDDTSLRRNGRPVIHWLLAMCF